MPVPGSSFVRKPCMALTNSRTRPALAASTRRRTLSTYVSSATRGAVIAPTDSYEGLLMNPSFIIDRMSRIVGTYGLSELHSNGTRFKRDREAWTTAIFALGQTHLTGKQYWVEIETREQTPDTRIHYIDQSTGRNNVGTSDVEVIDWDDHVEDPLELVRGKCRKGFLAIGVYRLQELI